MVCICFLSTCKETGQGGGRPLYFNKDKASQTLVDGEGRALPRYSQMYEDFYGNHDLNK